MRGGELPLLVAKADQELEPVGKRNRVDYGGSRRDGLDRTALGNESW